MEVFWKKKKKKKKINHYWGLKKITNLRRKKKTKQNLAAEGSKGKKFNLMPKSAGKMVICEEKNLNPSVRLRKTIHLRSKKNFAAFNGKKIDR